MTRRTSTIALVVVLVALSMPVSILADQHIVTLPLVANGDINPLYTSAPMKPFWRRTATAPLVGHVSGIATVTGLQTVVVRHYKNTLQRPVHWYIVAPDDDSWVAGELLQFGTFIFDSDTALILVVPTTHYLTWCYANTLIAVTSDEWVCGRAVFPPPCKEFWYTSTSLPMVSAPTVSRALRFWK